jgi:hypothetical protein
MIKIKNKTSQAGQSLVTMLVLMTMMITLTTGAVAVVISNAQATNHQVRGQTVLALAEAGVETATLRLLRNPNYTGETISLGEGTVTITVSGTTTQTITSTATLGLYQRRVQAVGTWNNNALTLSIWQEIN